MYITTHTQEDWNERSSLKHKPYSYSKTLAEKAAWDICHVRRTQFGRVMMKETSDVHVCLCTCTMMMTQKQKRWAMITINSGLVFGPVLSGTSGITNLSVCYESVPDVI